MRGVGLLLSPETAFGIAVACGLLTPLTIYVDWRTKGRTLTERAYWKAWWGTGGMMVAMLLTFHALQWSGTMAALGSIGGVVLGQVATFWYALLLEHCLRILGALASTR